jgi:uncharacterized membrane protein YjjP (DUF1212 family)
MSQAAPATVAAASPAKPPLDHDTLTDVIDLALWTGQLLTQHGAESQRVEETTHRLSTALGCDWMDVFVSANALVITTSSGPEFRTRVRRIVDRGVDMTIVSAINRLSRRVETGELDRQGVRSELHRISSAPRHYNRWLVVGMVGLACAAFCRLFGGEWLTCGVTLWAAATAMFVRQELTHRGVSPLLIVMLAAFVAGLVASSAALVQPPAQSSLALASSVLLLVPGVPMINAVEDMIKGHPVVGVARGVGAAVIALLIALGLVLAINFTGVQGL